MVPDYTPAHLHIAGDSEVRLADHILPDTPSEGIGVDAGHLVVWGCHDMALLERLVGAWVVVAVDVEHPPIVVVAFSALPRIPPAAFSGCLSRTH